MKHLVLEAKGEDQQVNVQNLPAGIYMLKVSLENGTEQSRTFVKR
ncbi:T9SS type A sorting domain-containing protein [Dyadobacter luticola]|uniref:T9SS type A sorting domain-containing protein n=1 Tax=Dyadobacter luticola TaxID=1979387 RepID=A0A5R9KTA5_9BACT|nr:T9SS type A sorting domain-containing protein [Dyadobacter luticola]